MENLVAGWTLAWMTDDHRNVSGGEICFQLCVLKTEHTAPLRSEDAERPN